MSSRLRHLRVPGAAILLLFATLSAAVANGSGGRFLQGILTQSDSPALSEVRQLQHRVIREKSLPPAAMARLKVLVNDPSPFVRARALTALGGLAGSKQAPSAIDIARTKVADREPLVRQYALSALEKLKAPDLRAQARKLLADPDANVRARAEALLKGHT